MDDPELAAHSAPEAAAQAAMAESELRRLGIDGVHVHPHGDLARLRVRESADTAMWTGILREEVVRAVRSAGFRFVSVDIDIRSDD
jgi:uncharacterized protein